MDKGKGDATVICPLHGSGKITEIDLVRALEKINESHAVLTALIDHTKHLPSIASSNEEIKTCLMSAAIGKEHVPLSVVEKLLKIFGWVIFGLVGVIVFLLTGTKFGWIPSMH